MKMPKITTVVYTIFILFGLYLLLSLLVQEAPEPLESEEWPPTFTSMQVFLVIEEGKKIRGFFTQEESARKYVAEHEGTGILPFEISPTVDLQMEFIDGDDGKLEAKLLNW